MNQRDPENTNLTLLKRDGGQVARDQRVADYRLRWRENPRQHRVERVPLHLDIESTSVCNLRCTFCAGTYEEYPRGYISREDFARAVDEGVAKGLCSIKLNFRGEPLLHPRIHELVAYAKQQGVLDVFFNTNATMLDLETGRTLIEAGLDRLIVSFEGFSKEVYEANRVGASFDKVVANVRGFARLKREMGSDKPLLRLQTVAVSQDPDYLRRYEEFWGEYADEITCIDLRDETKDYSGLKSESWECPYPWLRLCLTFDGQIFTCPFMNRGPDKYEWPGFGRLGERSLEEAWHSPEMERLRQAHREHCQDQVEPCRWCSHRGTELSKE